MNLVTDDIGTVVNQIKNAKWASLFNNDKLTDQAPFYQYGHRLEISNRLKEMGKDPVNKYLKFPSIILFTDVVADYKDSYFNYSLNIIIVDVNTTQDDSMARMENHFKPALIPLYEAFMDQLKKSGLFIWDNLDPRPPHVCLIRPMWGTPQAPPADGTLKNPFTDPLDVIEVLNLKMKSRKKNC